MRVRDRQTEIQRDRKTQIPTSEGGRGEERQSWERKVGGRNLRAAGKHQALGNRGADWGLA